MLVSTAEANSNAEELLALEFSTTHMNSRGRVHAAVLQSKKNMFLFHRWKHYTVEPKK